MLVYTGFKAQILQIFESSIGNQLITITQFWLATPSHIFYVCILVLLQISVPKPEDRTMKWGNFKSNFLRSGVTFQFTLTKKDE